MTDTDKLKRLLQDSAEMERRGLNPDVRVNADERQAILALIAENERLSSAVTNMEAAFKDAVSECDKLAVERDEAVAQLRRVAVSMDGDGGCELPEIVETWDFLARIDAAE